jgi:hypothetical protein
MATVSSFYYNEEGSFNSVRSLAKNPNSNPNAWESTDIILAVVNEWIDRSIEGGV